MVHFKSHTRCKVTIDGRKERLIVMLDWLWRIEVCMELSCGNISYHV